MAPQNRSVPAFDWGADLRATLQVVLLDDFANFDVPPEVDDLCLGGRAPLGVLAIRHWLREQSSPGAARPKARVVKAVRQILQGYSRENDCAKAQLDAALAAWGGEHDTPLSHGPAASQALPVQSQAIVRLADLLPELRRVVGPHEFAKAADVAFLLMGPLVQRWRSEPEAAMQKYAVLNVQLLRSEVLKDLMPCAVAAAAHGPADLLEQFVGWAKRHNLAVGPMLQDPRALQEAASAGYATLVGTLVKLAEPHRLVAADMRRSNAQREFNAFTIAALNGHTDTVASLAKWGKQQGVAPAEMLTSGGRPFEPFIWAAALGKTDTVAFLAALGEANGVAVEPMLRSGQDPFEAFLGACTGGHTDTLKCLVALAQRHGVPVAEMLQANGFAVFHGAAIGGHTDTLRYLVDLAMSHQVSVVDMVEAEEFKAFVWAAEGDHADALEFLIALLMEWHPEAIAAMLHAKACAVFQAALRARSRRILKILGGLADEHHVPVPATLRGAHGEEERSGV